MRKAELLGGQKTQENEAYWKQHVMAHRKSGLTLAAYCKRYQVHYDRFIYWSKKFSKSVPALVAVRIKPSVAPEMSIDEVRCTLLLKNNVHVRIESRQALALVLEQLA